MSYVNTKENFAQEYTKHINARDKTILSSNKSEDANKKITPALSSHSKWFNTVNIWIQRSRQRKQLARLDQHLLDDLGLTEEMVAKEIKKPFWK